MTKSNNPLARLWRKLPLVGEKHPTVRVIVLSGAIGISSPGSGRALNYERMEKSIKAAFKPGKFDAVALQINSPGGSPVQSRLIFNAIRQLADENDVPVLSFIEDVGASGGYMLAIAGDEIFADEASIVGSIGVISGGFGFPEALQKLGIERRVYTAGTNKGTNDPFQPVREEDVAHLKTILDDMHECFKGMVVDRRGKRVETDHDDTFTGRYWTANGARERGLIDGTGNLSEILKARYGKDVNLVKCSPQSSSLLSRLTGSRAGSRAGQAQNAPSHSGGLSGGSLIDPAALLDSMEERALWSRFGR